MLKYKLLNPGGTPSLWQANLGNQTIEDFQDGAATTYVEKQFPFIAPDDTDRVNLTFIFRHVRLHRSALLGISVSTTSMITSVLLRFQ